MQLSVTQEELNKLQQDYKKYKKVHSKSPIYRKATLTIKVGSTTYTIDEVGIRLKGNTSLEPVYNDDGTLNLSHYKLSFNETFDDEAYYGSNAKVWSNKDDRKARKNRRVATLKELDIKWNRNYDDTHIREIYASEIFRESGVLAQRIGLSQLKFNGSNYGVMTIYEPVDEIFLERYLPASALGGDLYKCGWTNRGCTYVKNAVTYGVENKETGTKYNYNLKTNKKKSTHAALKNLLSVLASSPSKSKFESVIDTDYLAKFLAASYFVGDPDDIRNNYNNHYIYFRADTGKAIFIPYDNDRTLGVTYGYNPDGTGMTGKSPFSSTAAGAGGSQQNPMIKYAILNRNAYALDKYKAALASIAASDRWNDATFNAAYNKAKSHYQDVVSPSVSFENVERAFRFSLDGRFTSGDDDNMSFSEYVRRIMQTYRNSI